MITKEEIETKSAEFEIHAANVERKVICPSTQKNYFLRVDPDVENAKQVLESTLLRYSRDWERDLVVET